jgi:hypothetical protein
MSKTALHKTARGVKLSKKIFFSHQSTATARADTYIYFPRRTAADDLLQSFGEIPWFDDRG